jgi:hypothetical protein
LEYVCQRISLYPRGPEFGLAFKKMVAKRFFLISYVTFVAFLVLFRLVIRESVPFLIMLIWFGILHVIASPGKL